VGEAGWTALPPAFDHAAAAMLADCRSLGSAENAQVAIHSLRHDDEGEIYGWVEDGKLIAVYGLRNCGLNFDLLWLAVDPAMRAQRYGRSALVDALRRCGRKPMTVEVDEAVRGWFQRVGFKTVGRKPAACGGFRYRLGWYAPRRPDEAGYGAH
jgi:ribosomal protein S18 acetylase RimI-like enzyme